MQYKIVIFQSAYKSSEMWHVLERQQQIKFAFTKKLRADWEFLIPFSSEYLVSVSSLRICRL